MNVAVGQDTSIGERTRITQSVIGKACTIGNDVHISNAYLWDNVTIKVYNHMQICFWLFIKDASLQDHCRISIALIADGVILNEGVELGNGCVIGPGVILAAGTKIDPNTRLMAHPPESNDDFENSNENLGEVRFISFLS